MNKKTSVLYKLILCSAAAFSMVMLSSHVGFSASWNIEDTLKAYVVEHYPWDEIEIGNVHLMGKLKSDAPVEITVDKGPLGKAVFSLYFKDGSKITARAQVTAMDWVVKSKRSFRKGHLISNSDVYVARMDIRRMPGSAVSDPSLIVGKTLKRSVVANIPIAEGMVDHSKVVKRGKKVKLLIESGGLNITTAGKIKEKGYVGMPVRAMNLSSKKDVIGVLIDENTVRVEL